MILTARMFVMLSRELDGDDAAMQHLLAASKKADRPIGCNFPTLDGSRTAFVAPPSWSQERLRGFVGARHEEIAAMFGPAVPDHLQDV